MLTGATLPGTSLYGHTQPLHWPGASSRDPATGCHRRDRYSIAPPHSGAAAVALGPPPPPRGSVLPPRRAPTSTALARASVCGCGPRASHFGGGQQAMREGGAEAAEAAQQRAYRGRIGGHARAHLQAHRAHRGLAVADAEQLARSTCTAVEIMKTEVSIDVPEASEALPTRIDARARMRVSRLSMVELVPRLRP